MNKRNLSIKINEWRPFSIVSDTDETHFENTRLRFSRLTCRFVTIECDRQRQILTKFAKCCIALAQYSDILCPYISIIKNPTIIARFSISDVDTKSFFHPFIFRCSPASLHANQQTSVRLTRSARDCRDWLTDREWLTGGKLLLDLLSTSVPPLNPMYLIIGTTVSLLRLPRSKKLLLSRLRHDELLFRFRIRVCKSVVGQYVTTSRIYIRVQLRAHTPCVKLLNTYERRDRTRLCPWKRRSVWRLHSVLLVYLFFSYNSF